MNTEVDEVIAERQRDVQRKLGRFLIRVQQYERLLKALVIDAENAGTVDTMQSFRDERTKRFATKSLGVLVEELTGSYLQLASAGGRAEKPVENGIENAVDKPSFRFRMGLEMSEADLARTKAELLQLVDLRNCLVHHLIERFDVWTLEGCHAALEHLEKSYEIVDAAFTKLRQWADSSLEARKYLADFMQSPLGIDMVFHGIMPDGAIHWPGSTVVELLRKAVSMTGDGEWTRLEDAIRMIDASHPDHTPKRYGCKTWRQVLVRSQEFDVRKVDATASTPGSIWYRSRQVT